MLTPIRFQKINGHLPTVEKNGKGFIASCECHCNGEAMALMTGGATEAKALEDLLFQVYKHHSYIACHRAGWKCSECGRCGPVSSHHRIPRSKGRDDRVGNLEPRCQICHDLKHG